MQPTTLLMKPGLITLTLKHQFCHINFYFNALWADHQMLGDSGRNADVIIHFSASKFTKSKERWEPCRKKYVNPCRSWFPMQRKGLKKAKRNAINPFSVNVRVTGRLPGPFPAVSRRQGYTLHRSPVHYSNFNFRRFQQLLWRGFFTENNPNDH